MIQDRNLASEREMGLKLPISVGTALAIEAFLSRQLPKTHDSLVLNLRTLVRNYYSSLPATLAYQIHPETAAAVVEQDLRTLSDALPAKLVRVLYYSEYSDLRRVIPHATLKTEFSDKQHMAMVHEQATIDALLAEKRVIVDVRKHTELKFPVTGKTLMLTHIPVDLLSRANFLSLDLLESYTGQFKNRAEWYTKLTGGKNLGMIPFNKFTLSVFGDNSVQLKASGLVLRRTLVELAQQCNWTTVTTDAKVWDDLSKIRDATTRDALKRMAHT